MNNALDQATAVVRYFPVYLESLRIDSVLDFDLYVSTENRYVLYRAADLPFTDDSRRTLIENNVRQLFIAKDKREHYQRYVESNIALIVNDPAIDNRAKAGIVYDNATYLVQDILKNPTLGENIKRGQAVVESTVAFVLRGQKAFQSMLKVMSFDYHIYSHSVNVCTFALALAQYEGTDSPDELHLLGTGALLHDIGKTRVPQPILNKNGPLSDQEMSIMKKHPRWGYDLVKTSGVIADESYFPILQHHERENRNGYPENLASGDIHPHSKIVAIADAFDAMTTRRSYRPAMSSFDALKTMYTEKRTFNQRLLDQFARLMGPTG